MSALTRTLSLWAALLVLMACTPDAEGPRKTRALLPPTPAGFDPMPFPEDNRFTPERYALGKRLFFDPSLSADSSMSCGSCHKPHLAFSDEVPLTPGVGNAPGLRNAPSLTNVGYQPYFTREGGVPTLEMHVLVPIQEHNEFNFNIVLIAERLRNKAAYAEMAQAAYGRELDPYVITRAIATFERTLISGNSRYDQFAFQGRPGAMNLEELAGMDLFFSDSLACGSCHGGFNFTNYAFENNGLYANYSDPGRMRLTGLETDRAKFKIPSLRNVELTAPYMFDGSLGTLEEVVAHYNSGGAGHPNQSGLVRPLGLDPADKEALVAFLKTLTDRDFISNPNHYPN